MDPVQWAFFIIQIAGDLSKLGIFVWLLTGGWKFVLRTIGFDIDTLLVSFIGRIYEYFMQVLSGTMFNEKVISELLQNVYVFVGVIMFFRLMMLVIKYLINPDLVSDAKAGVNSLIQRVIIGLAGILFIPTLFDFALQLQAHIMQDNIIQQIIVPKDMLKEVESKVDKGGQYIGTYVLAGFISPGENASKKTKTEYEKGEYINSVNIIFEYKNKRGSFHIDKYAMEEIVPDVEFLNVTSNIEELTIGNTTVYCFMQDDSAAITYRDGLSIYFIQIPLNLDDAIEFAKTIK